ncbi:cobalamin biosynthesis protein CobW [Marmoricola endophyticus]|uniref:Cobalamin biosynthesis protein CobW n=1 Tax=Marmoricola endophyticus TaxID=2040280 RepID=A0A917EY39_9ACTN|nr:cobalamin biosynthesis protein CobW [Marmoricola endophyticus]
MVTGVDAAAMSAAVLGLLWDTPDAVALTHHIDPDTQVLTRVVSDQTGEIEREEIPLEHACVSCALREDVLPTLDRLARQSRWRTIVARLPVGAPADQLAHALAADPRLARRLRLLSLVAVLDGCRLVEDLVGPATMRDRGLHTGPDDERGIGEVACSLVESADVVVLADPDPAPRPGDSAPNREAGAALVRALGRRDTALVEGTEHLGLDVVARTGHQHRRYAEHTSPFFPVHPDSADHAHVWQVELSTPRAFHPDRLLDELDVLADGAHRSRGCFWVPTRPGSVQVWDGAGGHLSLAAEGTWGRRAPCSRIVVTGPGEMPSSVTAGWERLLLTPAEARSEPRTWRVAEDGLEPWLGPIRDVA